MSRVYLNLCFCLGARCLRGWRCTWHLSALVLLLGGLLHQRAGCSPSLYGVKFNVKNMRSYYSTLLINSLKVLFHHFCTFHHILTEISMKCLYRYFKYIYIYTI